MCQNKCETNENTKYKENAKNVCQNHRNDPKSNPVNIMYTNARGLKGKLPSLLQYIDEEKPDVVGLTETWLKPGDILNIPGYVVVRADRQERRGGGVALILRKKTIQETIIKKSTENENEMLWIKTKVRGCVTTIGVLYGKVESRCTIEELKQYYDMIEMEVTKSEVDKEDLIIMGDLNAKIESGRKDRSGKLLEQLTKKKNLEIVNNTGKCEGR